MLSMIRHDQFALDCRYLSHKAKDMRNSPALFEFSVQFIAGVETYWSNMSIILALISHIIMHTDKSSVGLPPYSSVMATILVDKLGIELEIFRCKSMSLYNSS